MFVATSQSRSTRPHSDVKRNRSRRPSRRLPPLPFAQRAVGGWRARGDTWRPTFSVCRSSAGISPMSRAARGNRLTALGRRRRLPALVGRACPASLDRRSEGSARGTVQEPLTFRPTGARIRRSARWSSTFQPTPDPAVAELILEVEPASAISPSIRCRPLAGVGSRRARERDLPLRRQPKDVPCAWARCYRRVGVMAPRT